MTRSCPENPDTSDEAPPHNVDWGHENVRIIEEGEGYEIIAATCTDCGEEREALFREDTDGTYRLQKTREHRTLDDFRSDPSDPPVEGVDEHHIHQNGGMKAVLRKRKQQYHTWEWEQDNQ